jgi:hypothetical protein
MAILFQQPKKKSREHATAITYAVLGFLFLGYCLFLYFTPQAARKIPTRDGWDQIEITFRDFWDPVVFCTFPLLSVACLLAALRRVRAARKNIGDLISR